MKVFAWTIAIIAALGASVSIAQAQSDAEKKLEALVMEYTRLEDAMDMMEQSKLIVDDRTWHGVGGRRTNNPLWMKVQQENWDAFKVAFPNVKFHTEVRDLHIRLIGDNAAVTSFTWFANRIVPGDLPIEKVEQLGRNPVPTVISLVWENRPDGWKIVSSHNSPLYIRQ